MQRPVEERTGYLLKRAQQALRTRMDRELAAFGLGAAGYAVLTALASQPGLSAAELARRSFVTPQTMMRTVSSLQASGLVHRPAHPAAGRKLPAELTPFGHQVLAQAHSAIGAVEAEMVHTLDGQEQEVLRSLLLRIADALTAQAKHRT